MFQHNKLILGRKEAACRARARRRNLYEADASLRYARFARARSAAARVPFMRHAACFAAAARDR